MRFSTPAFLILGVSARVSKSAATPALALAASSYFSATSEIDKQPFTTWLLATNNASSYDHSIFLPTTADPTIGMATFWKITGGDNGNDENDASEFHLAFATKATGWAAFGIAEAGGMFGSDIVSFTTANPTTLVDGYILDDRQVRVDTHSQDWTLVSSTVEDGWIIVEATRRIDTGDGQDHVLKNDKELWGAPSRIIAAWGDSDVMSYHGDNRSSSSVRLFADPSSSSFDEEAVLDGLQKNADGYFDVVNDAYQIPAEATTYEVVCKSYDELKEQFGVTDITMIGATPIITEETRQFVHHFVVMAVPNCDGEGNVHGVEINGFGNREQVFGWAPGYQGMVFPDNVGLPMFDNEDKLAIRMQIHYNNPKLISGMRDSSGVRFHYTSTPRLHEAAFLQLGDPLMGLYGMEIADGLTKHEFTCGGSCSSLFLDEPVTILFEMLHMHKTGTRMVNEVIRGDEVIHTAKVEVFDFDQQGSFQPKQDAYQLEAGDKIRTTCYYKDGSSFGLGSEDEMCMGFAAYYPAKKYNGIPFICPYPGRFPCAQEYASTDLNDYEELGRTFGIGTPGLPVTSIEPPTPSNSNANTGSGENVNAFVPIPTPTSQATTRSKAEFMQHCLFVIALSSAVIVVTYV